MRLLFFFKLMMLCCSTAVACDSVRLVSIGRNQSGYVDRPGTYCLGKDLHHTDVFDLETFSTKRYTGSYILKIKEARDSGSPAGDYYRIDLSGHSVSAATVDMVGIRSSGRLRRAYVLNGRIIVPGRDVNNIGVFIPLSNKDVEGFHIGGTVLNYGPGLPEYEDTPFTGLQGQGKPRYTTTNHVIENMDIRAGYRGIVIGGGNNVIRDSRIEVDGYTALYAYGPGTIIENNTIIVHGKGDKKQWDAAIKLRDADNAIVRNNRIQFDGSLFEKGDAAINLLDSDNVKVEGNMITGHRRAVRVNGVSTFVESDTKPSL